MKIFSIKRLLGIAAIYGAVQYARKHGGARNAFNELLDKAKGVAGTVKDEVSAAMSEVEHGAGAEARSSGFAAGATGDLSGNGRGGY